MSTLLSDTLLDEIRQLHEQKQSGILVLTGHGGDRVEVFFREGMIEAVSSNLKARRLGDYLAKDGYIPARELDSIQSEAQRQKISFGEAAVRRKLLAQAQIGATVRRQAIDLIEHVFHNDFAVDSFVKDLRSYHAPAKISFPQILLELCRTNAGLFEQAPETRIVLRGGVDLSVFPWYPEELFLLNELKHPNTVPELVKTTRIKERPLKKALGVFQSLGVLDILEESSVSAEVIEGGALVKSEEFPLEDLVPVVTNAVLHEKLQIARQESSFASEQFRNLKVQIRYASSATALKVLTVSSPEIQDGKSLVSAALAFSFAMDPGRRVIVVDCDLRNPSLEQYLGVSTEPGLLQYIASDNMSPYCYVRRLENLYFMTTGGTTPNPIEILSLAKMKELIAHLKRDFDAIILDAPPYAPIADARIVTGLSDGLLMVLRRGKTAYSSTDRALQAIDRNKLIGVVFNDVQPRLFHTYQNFGHYSYGVKGSVYSNHLQIPKNVKTHLES